MNVMLPLVLRGKRCGRPALRCDPSWTSSQELRCARYLEQHICILVQRPTRVLQCTSKLFGMFFGLRLMGGKCPEGYKKHARVSLYPSQDNSDYFPASLVQQRQQHVRSCPFPYCSCLDHSGLCQCSSPSSHSFSHHLPIFDALGRDRDERSGEETGRYVRDRHSYMLSHARWCTL